VVLDSNVIQASQLKTSNLDPGKNHKKTLTPFRGQVISDPTIIRAGQADTLNFYYGKPEKPLGSHL
jgi:hypothetical protein